MSTAGFRIHGIPPQADECLVARFRALPTANVSDAMNRLTGTSCLRPWYDGRRRMAGTAVTVRTRPGDNLLVHKALDLARPGDVVVVDGGGDLNNALFGELMQLHAVHRGLAGVVIDGAIRDSALLLASEFPVFAKGVAHRGPYKEGPGEINALISVGGMTVAPGDLIVGDCDGILAIAANDGDRVATDAEAKALLEENMRASIAEGQADRSFIDDLLGARGIGGAV